MHLRTIDDDLRLKYRYSAMSDIMSRTLDSDRQNQIRSKTMQGKSITPVIENQKTRFRYRTIDDRVMSAKPSLKVKNTKIRSSLPKRIQHLILNQGLKQQVISPGRQNKFLDSSINSFHNNNIVFNYKPKINSSLQPYTNKNPYNSSQITKSLDYSTIQYKLPQKKRQNRPSNHLQKVLNRMKLILETYKTREQTLMSYICALKQEINILRQKQ